MKTSKLIFLIGLIHFDLCCVQSKSSRSLVPSAVSQIVFEHFANFNKSIDLIHYGKETDEGEQIVRELISKANNSITFEVSENNRLLFNPSLLLFDSIQTFQRFCRTSMWQPYFYFRNHHLVYVPKITSKDVLKNVPNGFALDYVNFISNVTNQSVDLITSYMFTSHACREHQVATVNRFKRSTMTWDNLDFYPNKYRNMFNCSIIISKPNSKKIDTRGTFRVFNKLASYTNSSIVYVEFRKDHARNRGVDIFGGYTDSLIAETTFKSTVSYPTRIYEKVFFIPPGELYTPFEKMFLPFQREFWIAIVSTLAIGCAIIQVINRTSLTIRNFCYGENIKTPTINMSCIFLTGAQYKIPRRNFARFILILFVWWCLIVRTCYQSELFKFLQADLRKLPVQSISEMLEKNFSFFSTPELQFFFGVNFRNDKRLINCLETKKRKLFDTKNIF